MDTVRDALLRMVRAGMRTRKLQKQYIENKLDDNQVDEIYGDIADSIFALIGEKTDTIDMSLTDVVLNSPLLTMDRRVEMLMSEYNANHKPAPHTFSREEMKRNVQKNGGYLHETPEGDWSEPDEQEKLIRNLRSNLKDCRNELCLRCGNSGSAHLGACDGCRWKDEWRKCLE